MKDETRPRPPIFSLITLFNNAAATQKYLNLPQPSAPCQALIVD